MVTYTLIRLRGKPGNEEILIEKLAEHSYLSPEVKTKSRFDECREKENDEALIKRMMEALRRQDRKTVDMVLQLGKDTTGIINSLFRTFCKIPVFAS